MKFFTQRHLHARITWSIMCVSIRVNRRISARIALKRSRARSILQTIRESIQVGGRATGNIYEIKKNQKIRDQSSIRHIFIGPFLLSTHKFHILWIGNLSSTIFENSSEHRKRAFDLDHWNDVAHNTGRWFWCIRWPHPLPCCQKFFKSFNVFLRNSFFFLVF